MKDGLVSRKEVMKALNEEYNRKAAEAGFPRDFGLKLAWIEKAVNSVASTEEKETGGENG